MESRYFKKHLESKDWTWDREVQSRILLQLDVISCEIANLAKKKNAKPAKPQKQFQPDYVEAAKKNYKAQKHEDMKEDLADLKSIFEEKNNNTKKLGN